MEGPKSVIVSRIADGAIVKNRFVLFSGNEMAYPTATEKADAVAQTDVSDTYMGSAKLLLGDRIEVEAEEAISAGGEIAVGTSGKAAAAASTDVVVAIAITAASADGDVIEALPLPRAQYTKA